MTEKIDEAALWERVAPQKGAPSLARQLTELLQEAVQRRQEYRRLGLSFAAGEVETLRGLTYYYSGEQPRVSAKALGRIDYLPALRRLMELEIHARGRFLALAEELSEPEKALLEDLAEAAEQRWKKLLQMAGKA